LPWQRLIPLLIILFDFDERRISVIFRVRSAKAVKITDLDLIKRLGIIVAIFTTFLAIRTMVGPPHVIVARTADDLKAYICQTDWWDHVFTASKSIKSAIQSDSFRIRFDPPRINR
jgi:hypothetical protein